ncbi:hypothetical protein TSUD_285940 [Trifolium subterraneum]|uniref:ATP-dependent DNA ligase family profile domain-containing protein n=1 Tax=Trifolium subterraneum TaxID=3900 RepID=A0A2Z6PBC5_TRISU|nr:hypothetical protein TSUD_285940 [Trifolium subterraneum]
MEVVCNLLRTVIHATPDDLLPVVYLFSCCIAPPHEGLEFGIGESTVLEVVADAYGIALDRIKEWNKKDLQIQCAEQTLLAALGQAAMYNEEDSKLPPEVQSPLEEVSHLIEISEKCVIARISSSDSFLQGWSTMLAIKVGHGEAADIVKQAYSVFPDFDKIVSALLTDGVWLLPKTCKFTLGVPVHPMLAKPINCVSDALTKFKGIEITCEYKYDGERAQIHYLENGLVEIYSRKSERITGKFPDVVAAVSRLKKIIVSSFVLDCELVAYDRAMHKILILQELSTRARKDVGTSDIEVNVCIFAFDLLYLNGQTLLQENLIIRREHLYASFEEESEFLQFATSITSNDAEEIQKLFDKAVGARQSIDIMQKKPNLMSGSKTVFEVKASDLTCSSEYPAAIGLVNPDKLLTFIVGGGDFTFSIKGSLRGARLVAVAKMYKAQEQRKESNKQSNMTNEDKDGDEDADKGDHRLSR